MEDKKVIIMEVFPLQQGKPFEFSVMLDGESKKISSWEKQEMEVGKSYIVTLLDEDPKDVKYNQRRMKKDSKVELLVTEKQGTLDDDDSKQIFFEEVEPEKPKEESKVKTKVEPKVEPKATPTDDFEDEFMGMIEDEEKANDKHADSGQGSQLAVSNHQRSVLPANPNKLQLTIESIKILNPLATEQNAMKFLQKCIWQNLNPFIGDCYLITYQNKQTGKQDMSMVVSKDVFLKRSASNPNYEGFEAGIIVRVGKELKLDYREGSVYIKGEEELIGGWAKVHIKGINPVRAEVLVAEYHSGKALWNTKTATMIRKVALSQAMREAHPIELQGLYDGAEIEANE